MIELFWRLVARALARPAIADSLIARAQRTPYLHIMSQDCTETYMGRWWLFNPYSRETGKPARWWFPWSVRIHHICRADADRDLHDHPWNARTIILRGGYVEQRLIDCDDPVQALLDYPEGGEVTEFIRRQPGSTASLRFGEYHRIDSVSQGGAWTLFISGPKRGVWGFLVKGVKVPWRTYLGLKEGQDLPQP